MQAFFNVEKHDQSETTGHSRNKNVQNNTKVRKEMFSYKSNVKYNRNKLIDREQANRSGQGWQVEGWSEKKKKELRDRTTVW